MWKKIILKKLNLLDPILEGIHQDRIGASVEDSLTILREVIKSFVGAEIYKKPCLQWDVSIISFTLIKIYIYFSFMVVVS